MRKGREVDAFAEVGPPVEPVAENVRANDCTGRTATRSTDVVVGV